MNASTVATPTVATPKVSLWGSLVTALPELNPVTLDEVKKDTARVILGRIVLRAFAAHAVTGSKIDLSEKSLKGAFLSNAANTRIAQIAPKANEWKTLDHADMVEKCEEMAALIDCALTGNVGVQKEVSELDKARKYIKGLSDATVAALRKEGVI